MRSSQLRADQVKTVQTPFLTFSRRNTVETSINLSDGDRDITICLRDAAGLTNKYVESITVDTVNPSGFMTINQGATHTTDNVVTVNITKSDNVSEMKLVNGQTIDCTANGSYVPVSLSVTHTLADQDGTRGISGCLRKPSGRWVQMEPQTIIVDSQPPRFDGVLEINNGERLTNNPTLSVSATGLDQVSKITHYSLTTGSACSAGYGSVCR